MIEIVEEITITIVEEIEVTIVDEDTEITPREQQLEDALGEVRTALISLIAEAQTGIATIDALIPTNDAQADVVVTSGQLPG